MEIAKVKVSGARCTPVSVETITQGMVGATVSIEYTDPLWDGLTKTVVFRGAVTRDVLNAGTEVSVPPEVLCLPMPSLYIGVYGVNADGTLVVPTLWANLGRIRCAADPSGDPSTDPSLPVWAQIQALIGDLDKLDTEAKNSLVAAVNEAMQKGGNLPKITAEAEGKYLKVENGVAVWSAFEIPKEYGLITYDGVGITVT